MDFLENLQILEQYCENAGINLVWSFWDRISLNKTYVDESINGISFKYLIDSGVRNWDKDEFNNDVYLFKCHEELRKTYLNTFDLGGDIITDRFRAHFGVHKHTHIAEKFIEYIENNWDI